MFKLMLSVLSLASLFGTASAQLTASQVDGFILQFQGSRPAVLSSAAVVFDCPNCAETYQSKARAKTVADLANQNVAAFNVRQYYVLACLYFATNGVSNPRTNAIIPGEEIPTWTTDDWFSTINYCEWFGVACFNTLASTADQTAQEAQQLVVEINLSENNLYGQFPNEIALLSASLIAIDLFGNFFHWCGDYRWMNALGKLEALFFGSTSWDADGVPFVLRFLTNLQELDISNTFWRGILTENAFNNLKKLRYLDIGQNFFDFQGISEIPDYISGLPVLTNLYIDNIRPSAGSSGGVSLDLSFISRMPNIIEMWADYTNVLGPIPDDIGDANTLQSLSLVYCKLTGTIPNSIVNTQLDRLWLYGNPNLGGGFPAGFGNLDWTFLYLEGTGIVALIPKAVCEQRGPEQSTDLVELGADCDICPTNCCSCCGDACSNLRSPTPAPTSGDAPAGPIFCFSGDSTVEVQGQGFVKMSNLNLGDSINVGDNKFEPIYSFGHKNAHASGEFISIHAEGGRKLELSSDHMVTLEGGDIVPAGMVQVGDSLVTASGNTAAVQTIRTVKRAGLYAPFTESGKVVVNDVVASNYVAFQGQQYYTIAGIETPFNYHWMAHIFKSVHRIAYKMGFATSETYTEDGTSTWVSAPRDLGLWLLDQNPIVMILGLVGYIAIFGSLTVMESYPLTMLAAVLTVLVARRSFSVSLKMNKM